MNFFILGNPRSGTTLLRLMLNNHSEIGVPPECGMIQWWYEKYKYWPSSKMTDIEFALDILSSRRINDWQICRETVITAISKASNYGEVFTEIYKIVTHKNIVGDKNNYYINHIETLKSIYPNAKYVHIVRDGRDVACSYLKLKELDANLINKPNLPTEIKEIAKQWVSNNLQVKSKLDKEKYITVLYEDLIKHPSEELTKISSFLNVNFEVQMLEYYKNNNEPESTLNWKLKTKEAIDKNNMNKYKKILNKKSIGDFNEIARDMLIGYGYEVNY